MDSCNDEDRLFFYHFFHRCLSPLCKQFLFFFFYVFELGLKQLDVSGGGPLSYMYY